MSQSLEILLRTLAQLLIGLGFISGIALIVRAINGANPDAPGMGTLWTLSLLAIGLGAWLKYFGFISFFLIFGAAISLLILFLWASGGMGSQPVGRDTLWLIAVFGGIGGFIFLTWAFDFPFWSRLVNK